MNGIKRIYGFLTLFILIAFVSLTHPAWAGDPATWKVEDFSGEWTSGNGDKFFISGGGTSIIIENQQRQRTYNGSFAPRGFEVTFRPRSESDFQNPNITPEVRRQLLATGYTQRAQVAVNSKRSLTLTIQLDNETHKVEPGDPLKYIQPRAGQTVYNLTRPGLQITQVDVQDNDEMKRRERERIEREIKAREGQLKQIDTQGKALETECNTIDERKAGIYKQMQDIQKELAKIPAERIPPEDFNRQQQDFQRRIDSQKEVKARAESEVAKYSRQRAAAQTALTNATNAYNAARTAQNRTGTSMARARQNMEAAQDRFNQENDSYNVMNESLTKANDAITSLERQKARNPYKRNYPDQQKFDRLNGQLNGLTSQHNTISTELNGKEEALHNARIHATEIDMEIIRLKDELKKPPPFVQKVQGTVDGQVVYESVFDTTTQELTDLDKEIRELQELNTRFEQMRKSALGDYIVMQNETIAAGNILATAQLWLGVSRGLADIGSDLFDIARATGEGGPAGGLVELGRKVTEKIASNYIEGTIKGEKSQFNRVFKPDQLSLSSSVEKEVEQEIMEAFQGQGHGDASAEEALADKRGEDTAKTLAKRAGKEGVGRNVRNFFNQRFFNSEAGQKAFNWISEKAPFGATADKMREQLTKLQNPSPFSKDSYKRVKESVLKDLAMGFVKAHIDAKEVEFLKDYLTMDMMAREKYASYQIVAQRSFATQDLLDAALAKRKELQDRNVDLATGFKNIKSEEFDPDSNVEISITLKRPADPPEKRVQLNTAAARGGRQRYFVKATKEVAGAAPKAMTVQVQR